jgi:hypothetical protein
MHTALVNAALAAAPYANPLPDAQAPSWLKVAAIAGLIVSIASIVLMVFGLGLTMRAKKGDLKGAARSSGVAGIGLFWIVLGVTGVALGVVSGSVSFFVNG